MAFRAVGRRCAVVLSELQLPFSDSQVLEALVGLGFRVAPRRSIVDLARGCIGNSKFRERAPASLAPGHVDCSLLTQWLYGQLGIWLPRRAQRQYMLGKVVVAQDVLAGDLVFISEDFPMTLEYGAYHVGVATGENTVIHASLRRETVVEMPIVHFYRRTEEGEHVGERRFRRFAPLDQIVTFIAPPNYNIQLSSDLRRIAFRALGG